MTGVPTVEDLARQVMELARTVGAKLHGPQVSWGLIPYNPNMGLGDLALMGATNYVTKQAKGWAPIRAAIRAQVKYRQGRRVLRAAKMSARRAKKAGKYGALMLMQLPQILTTFIIALVITLLVYGLWVVARKIENVAPWDLHLVPSAAQCQSTTVHTAGFLWWGKDDNGRGTSFTDFAGAMTSWVGRQVHISEKSLVHAAAWSVAETGTLASVAKHSLSTGNYFSKDQPAASPGGAVPSSYGSSCCATTASALPAGGVPAAYKPGQADTAAMTAARAAQAAGWSGSELVMAVAVAGAESGWNPLAQNAHSTAKGLWQIMMSLHADKFNGASWQDPAANARVAKVIYDDAGGWSPWSVFTSGAYQSRMAEAQTAVTAIGVAPLPAAVPVASCTVPSSSGGVFPSAFDQLGNPNGVEQALNWDAQMAANQTPVVEFRCDHYVAEAYGWSSSGSVTARAHWEAIPASLKHAGADGVPPRGAIVFFNTSAAGHVAVSDGQGNVYTTDRIAGRITLETLAHIDGWGGRLGWAAPYFFGHSHLPAATTA